MAINSSNLKFNVILRCLRGIEQNLFKELQSFGIDRNSLITYKSKIKVLNCSLKHVYFLSYFSRLASNVYFEVGKVQLSDKENVFKSCESIQWNNFMSSSQSYIINCSLLETNAYINSKKYACQLVKDGIAYHYLNNLKTEPPRLELKNPDIKLDIDVDEDCSATVMLDAVGSDLSSRGYRYKPNIEDIDPTMACSILFDIGYFSFSGPFSIDDYDDYCKRIKYDYYLSLEEAIYIPNSQRSSSLNASSIVDLFSGCGVFIIESALWSAKIAPGSMKKKFAFQILPTYDDLLFESLKTYANNKKVIRGTKQWDQLCGRFIGIERDWEKLEASLKSSETAGVLELVSFNQADYLKDGINDAKITSGDGAWEYMVLQLPQMKEVNKTDPHKKTKRQNGFNKIVNKLSAERYLTLLKSLSGLRKEYFEDGSKGVLMLPSFIDKIYIEDSFNSKLSVGKSYNKNGITNTTYYTT